MESEKLENKSSLDVNSEIDKTDIKLDEKNHQSEEIVLKVAGGIPISAWFIIVTELCERLAFYGANLLFMPFMMTKLNLNKAESTAINRTFQFFAYFTTVIGAILADTYFGKFKTIIIFSIFYLIGLILVSISSTDFSIESGFGLIGFCLSIFLFIACGTGGIKANVSAFAAEQIVDKEIEREEINKKGEKIKIDYNMTVERLFRYFYWAINVGSLIGQMACPVVAHNLDSYPWAFSIPAFAFLLAIMIFIGGKTRYRIKEVEGNPIFKVFKTIKFALAQKRKSKEIKKDWLEYAKVEYETEWDHQFVDDLRKTLSACKVMLFYIMYWAVYNNMFDGFITQGMNMNRPSWLGAEQLNVVNSLVLVISIPIFDYFVFPFLKRRGFKLGLITRISIGFTICTLSFLYVTILQAVLYNTGPYYNFTNLPPGIKVPVNDLSIWYQLVPYGTIAISEIFSSATGLEYAYKNAAPQLKSVVMALFLFTNCGGSLIGLVLAIWSVDPNYIYIFGVQTAAMAIFTIVFYCMFKNTDE